MAYGLLESVSTTEDAVASPRYTEIADKQRCHRAEPICKQNQPKLQIKPLEVWVEKAEPIWNASRSTISKMLAIGEMSSVRRTLLHSQSVA
jgi:hypothetical protein